MEPSHTIRAEQIPIALTSMTGRADETAHLLQTLEDPSTRLITITGPSGVGKTRLALHVAGIIGETSSPPPIFISLGAVSLPELVLQSIGMMLGVISHTVEGEYEEVLQHELAATTALLVLDNLEQVLTVGPSLARLLKAAPGIRILATSQAPLNIPEETVFQLATLETPAPDEESLDVILASPVVKLFVDRAQNVNTQFRAAGQESVIGDLCRALDGLPLAIELAAARTNIFTPRAMLGRLQKRLDILSTENTAMVPRQRSMRAAVSWTYDLLAPEEQYLFRRLSTFAGGFTVEAVERLATGANTDRSPYDLLGALANHSLVQTAARNDSYTRYFMLETMREYGLEQLERLGELDAAQLQHTESVVALAEYAGPRLVGEDQEAWVRRLDDAIDNVRLAISWSLRNNHPDYVCRICDAIWRYLSMRALSRHGLHWMQQALSSTGHIDAHLRARAQAIAGFLALDVNAVAVAQTLFEQSRLLASALGMEELEVKSLIGLGSVAGFLHDYDLSEQYHLQAGELARRHNDLRSISIILTNLAGLDYRRGNMEAGVTKSVEAIRIMEELGDRSAIALTANNLGATYIELGKWDLAEPYLQRSLEYQTRIQDAYDIPITLGNLAEIANERGDYTQAYNYLIEAANIARQTGSATREALAIVGLANLAITQHDIEQALDHLRAALQLCSEPYDVLLATESAHQFQRICMIREDYAAFIELDAAITAILAGIQMPRLQRKMREIATFAEIASNSLSSEEIDTLRAAGARMDTNELAHRILTLIRARKEKPQHLTLVRPPEPVSHNLTPREIEILQLLAQGYSTQRIADELYISPRTIATHVTSILGKLGVQNRTAAVAWALRVGIA